MHPRLGEEVAAAFDLGSLGAEPEPVARGEQGRVWKLTTERGEFAVKELFVLQTEADAAMDVAYQEAVLSAGSVPMPRPVRRFDGDVLAGVGDLLVRVYEWVDLLPANLDLDPTLIGRTIAAIHRVRHEPAPPEHPWYTDPVGRAKWRELSRQLAASGAPFADAFAAEVPTLIELEDLLAPWPAGRLQNCHRDLWADNILPTPAGGVFVIDWENCGLADPGQEVAMALFDFGYRDAGRYRLLHDAYLEAGGIGRLDSRGSLTMVIAQFGHFYEMAAEQWLAPDATEESRARAINRIDEALQRPLTVELVDEMLDAIHA